jgi:ornithine cyclodeaminase
MTFRIIDLDQIQSTLPSIGIIPLIEAGFVAYSDGLAVVPAVGELSFIDPPGDVHIKYGYIAGDRYYVIKIASGFYNNPSLGLPVSTGLMLVFEQNTGQPACILLDGGHLTRVRTGAAGAIAAKYFAPRDVHRIGVVGMGNQARMQLTHLKDVVDCRDVIAWGLPSDDAAAYRQDMEGEGFSVQTTTELPDVVSSCNLIVTVTPSKVPLVRFEDVQPGTHITAVGADTPEKQELDSRVLGKADIVVADSISQCQERGEISHALREGIISVGDIVELGDVIAGRAPRRTAEEQTTVVDLTGVAVQDIQIAKAVYEAVDQASK